MAMRAKRTRLVDDPITGAQDSTEQIEIFPCPARCPGTERLVEETDTFADAFS
jgi:hypothetical protein